MTRIFAAIYDPPSPQFPVMAVILREDGKVLSAQAVASRESGQSFIQSYLKEHASAYEFGTGASGTENPGADWIFLKFWP